MQIRNFHKSDFSSVKSIYQQGIDTGNATFQKKAKAWNEWNLSFLSSCRIVAEMNGEVAPSLRIVFARIHPFDQHNVMSYGNCNCARMSPHTDTQESSVQPRR